MCQDHLDHLFENNRKWVQQVSAQDPELFSSLAQAQAPQYLWIGCSDSRVPANEIVGLSMGDLFVHRNVANLVVHTDLNCQSVLQYAVEVLRVRHIIVCGHYGCGGIRAALEATPHGLIDSWLGHIRDTYDRHRDELDEITDDRQRVNLLAELNVEEQVRNVCNTTTVRAAWDRVQPLTVHGWIYDIENGRLHGQGLCFSSMEDLEGKKETERYHV